MSRLEWSSLFEEALPYEAFLERYATPAQRQRWDASHKRTVLEPDQRALLGGFERRMPVLVLNGAWCGDCINQCPIFEHFAGVSRVVEVRYLDRDARREVREELMVNGGHRVPVVVFLSEDFFEVARYGDRALSVYRRLAMEQLGASCPTGLAGPGEEAQSALVGDWLAQFERAQLMLRLSPRLRTKHGD